MTDLPLSAWRPVVTGGAGFIGSTLTRHLVSQGARVTVLDAMVDGSGANAHNLHDIRDDVRFLELDLASAADVTNEISDATHIFHLAAQIGHAASMENPIEDLEANAKATLRLLDEVRHAANDPAFVFTSTRQVYGRPRTLPVSEDHPTAAPDINAVHKLAAEEYMRVYGRVYGTRGVILRLSNVFGPRMRVVDARQTFFGLWLRLAIEGRPIAVFGDGNQRRDLTYVDDVVTALVKAAGLASSEVPTFNVGGEVASLSELAQLVVAGAGSGSIEHQPLPPNLKAIDVGDFIPDDRRFRAASEWEPSVGLQEGIRRCLDFFRTERTAYF